MPSAAQGSNGRILIAGAGVAGLAVAYWLKRYGFEPEIVETSSAPRLGGQAIDLRGVALQVIDRMCLNEAVESLRTRQKGVIMMDGYGNETWRSDEMTLSAGRFDSGDIEILRDDLCATLAQAAGEMRYRFGDRITAVCQNDTHVDVSFRSGASGRYRLVIGADGVNSSTRDIVFGEGLDVLRYLGQHVAIFAVENFIGLEDRQVGILGETSGALLFPTADNREVRVFAAFALEGMRRGLDRPASEALISAHCANLGWRMPEILKAMPSAPDLYFGPMAQVHMRTWSEGGVTLLGDAAFCPSPISGQGTSLAIVGAYILAEELDRAGREDQKLGLAEYERRMRPFVEANQALAQRDPKDPIPEEALEHAKNLIVL